MTFLHHRLVIDLQTVQSVRFTERGIPRYANDFARALVRGGAPIAGLALNPSLPLPRRMHPELSYAPELCWNTARRFRWMSEAGPLAYHVMSTLEGHRPVQSTLPPYALSGDVPLVCTVYDFIPERLKVAEVGSPFERLYRLRRHLVRAADLVFAISEATRRDALELLGLDPDRVVTVGTGASEFFRPPLPSERPAEVIARRISKIDRPFALAVTGVFGIDTRKNTEGLISAFSLLPPDIRRGLQLVVTCQLSANDERRWMRLAREHGLAGEQLVLTGYVPDVVLRALYQQAALFVNPSLYEGFGLPALEAAQCGCPTITSNTSALPEVLDLPSATFDPTNPEEMASLMAEALTDEGFRATLRAAAASASRRHTWDAVAEKAIAGYCRLDPPRPRRSRRRLRIALVGPLPPMMSQTASYNAMLAPRLAERCELDCITEGASERSIPNLRLFRVFAPNTLGRVLSAHSYDAIFYTLASGREHDRTYELALSYPGIVWLHEVNLADLYLEFARARFEADGGREFMANTLRHHYRERAPEHLIESEHWASAAAHERVGARMSAELAAKSRGAIVNTEVARSLLDLDAGPHNRLPRTWVVPLGAPPPLGEDGEPSRAADADEAIVLSLDEVTDDADLSLLLDAFAIVGASGAARLVVAGEVGDEVRHRADQRLAAGGLRDRVEVVGGRGPNARRSWLGRAACAVHLGRDRAGTASVAVAEALARGLPVVTTLPSCAELPAGTVRMVPSDASAEDLAAELLLVLAGPERERVRQAALRYARSWTVDDVVGSLLDIARWDASVRGR